MIFRKPFKTVPELQKVLDSEKPKSPTTETWNEKPIDGCDCCESRAPSIRLGFPDPVSRGGEA